MSTKVFMDINKNIMLYLEPYIEETHAKMSSLLSRAESETET
jgi:hypothetical protein